MDDTLFQLKVCTNSPAWCCDQRTTASLGHAQGPWNTNLGHPHKCFIWTADGGEEVIEPLLWISINSLSQTEQKQMKQFS